MKPTDRRLTRFTRIVIANLASSVSTPSYVVKSLLLLIVIIPGTPALADVKLKMDCTKELVNTGGAEPVSILWDIWGQCQESGCGFFEKSFQTRVHDTDCETGTTHTCTVKLDGQYPGFDMRNIYADALLQAIGQVQRQEGKSVKEYNLQCHPGPTGSNCFSCVDGDKWVADWLIPAKKRIYGWDTDGKYKGYLQYTIDCHQQKQNRCPDWFGTATSGIMTFPHPVTGVVGNGVNFVCGLMSFTGRGLSSEDAVVWEEWDRNVPLASMPKNCQDGGWRNATKDVWETKYRNCPLPDPTIPGQQ